MRGNLRGRSVDKRNHESFCTGLSGISVLKRNFYPQQSPQTQKPQIEAHRRKSKITYLCEKRGID